LAKRRPFHRLIFKDFFNREFIVPDRPLRLNSFPYFSLNSHRLEQFTQNYPGLVTRWMNSDVRVGYVIE